MTPQDYDRLHQQVKDVLSTFDDNQDLYSECKRIQKELNAIGYDCDYDLSGTITEVTDLYTRRCHKTNRPITREGFCVLDGEYYFLEQSDLIEFLKSECGYDGDDDDTILYEAFDEGHYYWTEWEDIEIYND